MPRSENGDYRWDIPCDISEARMLYAQDYYFYHAVNLMAEYEGVDNVEVLAREVCTTIRVPREVVEGQYYPRNY